MRVLITGATGFVGEHVVQQLLPESCEVIAFVRPSSSAERLREWGITLRVGDLADVTSFQAALKGVDVLLNIASLGFGHAPHIVRAAEAADVRRAVFLSTTAVFTRLPAPSQALRLEAERLIRRSRLRFTILRPTMIYGTPRDRNIWRLITYLRRWPAIPVIGAGGALQQPVYVEDVAGAVARAMQSDHAIGRTYNLGGAVPLTFAQMIDVVCEQLGRRVAKVHVPVWSAVLGARLLGPLGVRITPEQVRRLEEDKAVDISSARADLCYTPLAFHQGLAQEIRYLGRRK